MSNIAYYCLHKFNMRPSEFISLTRQERAFIIAAIDIKIKNDLKENKKLKSNRNRR